MKRYVEVLNETLLELLREDERVHVFGESIEDPYGGAFKVTKGLSKAFPGRVFDTPISEAGLIGLAGGMALRGLRPVVEIMFGDFLTLGMDQLLNSLTKFTAMYGEAVDVPVVVRTPMGGRRGYGPTHSQSIEKLFLGIPRLDVVSPAHVHDVRACVRELVLKGRRPTLLVENKLLYAERLLDDAALAERGWRAARHGGALGTVVLSPIATSARDATLIAYGGMAPIAMEAAGRLAREEGLGVEVVLPARIAPLDLGPIAASVRASGRAVVAEEGTRTNGWGAEVACRLYEERGLELGAPIVRVAARDEVLPSSKELEAELLPDQADIEDAILSLV
jgi:pyruvate/2-oxoglutarate/acetoin dehydrogenase E1 component